MKSKKMGNADNEFSANLVQISGLLEEGHLCKTRIESGQELSYILGAYMEIQQVYQRLQTQPLTINTTANRTQGYIL